MSVLTKQTSNRASEKGKPKNASSRKRKFWVFVYVVILVFILVPTVHNVRQRSLVEKEIEEIKKDIQNQEKENKDLKEMIQYLQSDSSLEEQARLNLGLKKPGETVVVVKEDYDIASSSGISVAKDGDASNFQKWLDYFFK